MTQNEQIAQHLKEHGSITSMEAFMDYGITRLSARIYELRHMGMQIFSVDETATNRYGEKTRYSRYRLKRV